MWRVAGPPSDSYYEVRPECTSVPQVQNKAGKPLSSRKWQAAFTPEGCLDIGKTLGRICRGGIHPSIRGEVWEFLLGCYDPQSTFDQRDHIRKRRRDQYAVIKEEGRLMFPIVGSGRIITAPIIAEDGEPNQDPLVLEELSSLPQGNDTCSDFYLVNETEEKVILWKLTLHQIGEE